MARPIRVAINGFGRIGKMVFRALLARGLMGTQDDAVELAAVNDLTDPATVARLLAVDSAHGKLPCSTPTTSQGAEGNHFLDFELDGRLRRVRYVSEPDPTKLPWEDLGMDVVLECTGRFVDADSAGAHLTAGAQRVIISSPAKGVPLFVVGVNDRDYLSDMRVISNASCTTNCAAPIARAIHEVFCIQHANLLTVHAATAGENVVDGLPPGRKGSDLRLARSALVNMIPTKTGAAKAVGEVLPNLDGKFDGVSVRVPVQDGSYCHCTFEVAHVADVDDVLRVLEDASDNRSYRGVIEVDRSGMLVSADVIGNPHSAIVDAEFVRVADGRQVIVGAWYDNEWGYSHRMVDLLVNVVGPTL